MWKNSGLKGFNKCLSLHHKCPSRVDRWMGKVTCTQDSQKLCTTLLSLPDNAKTQISYRRLYTRIQTWSVNTFGHNSGQQLLKWNHIFSKQMKNYLHAKIVWPLKNPVSPQVKFVDCFAPCSRRGLALSLSPCRYFNDYYFQLYYQAWISPFRLVEKR